MRYAKADRIAAVVNGMVPSHEVSVVAPDVIENKRVANCFARAALVGVGLLESGVHERDMTMLISMNHGVPKAAYGISSEMPYWLSYTMLLCTSTFSAPSVVW